MARERLTRDGGDSPSVHGTRVPARGVGTSSRLEDPPRLKRHAEFAQFGDGRVHHSFHH